MQGTASLGTGNAVLLGGTLSDQYIPVQYQTLTGAKSYTIQSHNGRSARCSFLGHTQLSRPDPAQPVSPDNIQTITPISNPALLQYSGDAVQISAPDIVPMMALPNGIKDEITVQGGKWGILRKIIKLVANGTETIRVSERADTQLFARFEISSLVSPVFAYGYCPYFSWALDNGNWINPTRESVSKGAAELLGVVIKKSRLNGWSDSWTAEQKVTAFKTWLAANPITFYYQIVTPIFEPVAAFNGFGSIEPVTPVVSIVKPNPDAPISPDNIAAITGTTVATQGYRGNVRQIQGDFYNLPNGAADEYDGQKIIKKIVKYEITGKELIWSSATGIQLRKLPVPGQRGTVGLCTHATNFSLWGDGDGCNLSPFPQDIIANWSSFAAGQFEAGTPITLIYQLRESTSVYCKSDLSLDDGQNTISCDDPVMQELTVREIDSRAVPLADTSHYADQLTYNSPQYLGIVNEGNLLKWAASQRTNGWFHVLNTVTEGVPVPGRHYSGKLTIGDNFDNPAADLWIELTDKLNGRTFYRMGAEHKFDYPVTWQELVTTETESFKYLGICKSGDIFDFANQFNNGTLYTWDSGRVTNLPNLPGYAGGWWMGTLFTPRPDVDQKIMMLMPANANLDNLFICKRISVASGWGKWHEIATTETGTWAPRLSGTATGGVWAPTSIIATYIKTTKNITVYFFMTGSFTGASGSLQILGLPVVPKDYYGVGTVCYTAGLQATGVTNALNMVELTITNAGAPVQAQSISGTITLCGSCTYNI